MNQIILNGKKNNNQFLAVDALDKKCSCLQCGACYTCFVFLPFLAVALAPALGINLYTVQVDSNQ